MWRVAAFADFDGLACFETFFAIWPKDPALTVPLAAVLNGPVANAYLAVHCGRREFTIKAVDQIPFPQFSGHQLDEVTRLVGAYKSAVGYESGPSSPDDSLADRILREIDAVVLDAYNLPPRLERRLLDFFNGSQRQVPFTFSDYFSDYFEATIPLSMYLSAEFQASTGDAFLCVCLRLMTQPSAISSRKWNEPSHKSISIG